MLGYILLSFLVHVSIEHARLAPLTRRHIRGCIYTQRDVTFFICIYEARGASSVPRAVDRQLSEVADMGLPLVPPPPVALPPAFPSKVSGHVTRPSGKLQVRLNRGARALGGPPVASDRDSNKTFVSMKRRRYPTSFFASPCFCTSLTVVNRLSIIRHSYIIRNFIFVPLRSVRFKSRKFLPKISIWNQLRT